MPKKLFKLLQFLERKANFYLIYQTQFQSGLAVPDESSCHRGEGKVHCRKQQRPPIQECRHPPRARSITPLSPQAA
jgi:hypothetical protein